MRYGNTVVSSVWSGKDYLLIPILSSIFLFAWLIQNHLFLNYDVGFLLYNAKQILAGEQYLKDFFTPNPPTILWLYAPSLILAKLLNLKVVLAFRAYIFSLAMLSLYVCCHFLKTIFLAQDVKIYKIFLVALAATFLIFPFHQFGQREHLLFILSMPYILLVTCRLEGHVVPWRYALLVGLLAGIGCSIKPQFLLAPIFIELYFIFHQRNILAWIRTETLTAISLLLVCTYLTLFFYKNYVFFILPYLIKFYYYSLGTSWKIMLLPWFLYSSILVCILPTFLYCIWYKENRYKTFSTVLLITLISFLFIYLFQHTLFVHHILPATLTAFLLQVLLFCTFLTRSYLTRADYFFMLLMTLALGLFYYAINLWVLIIFNLYIPAVFFFFLFSMLFFMEKKAKGTNVFLKATITALVGFLVTYLARHILWHKYALILAALILACLFCLMSKGLIKNLLERWVVVVFSFFLFAMPAYSFASFYFGGLNYKERVFLPLATFIQNQKPHTSVCVLSGSTDLGTVMHDVNVEPAFRFDCLWEVSVLMKATQNKGDKFVRHYLKNTDPRRGMEAQSASREARDSRVAALSHW